MSWGSWQQRSNGLFWLQKSSAVQKEPVSKPANKPAQPPESDRHASHPKTTPSASTVSPPPSTYKDKNEDAFIDSSFRVCKTCKKSRILDKRATNKFPLGTYDYGGNKVPVQFTCDMLVETTCSSEEDIVPYIFSNDKPKEKEQYLIVELSTNPRIPTCAIMVITGKPKETISAYDIIHDAVSYTHLTLPTNREV